MAKINMNTMERWYNGKYAKANYPYIDSDSKAAQKANEIANRIANDYVDRKVGVKKKGLKSAIDSINYISGRDKKRGAIRRK